MGSAGLRGLCHKGQGEDLCRVAPRNLNVDLDSHYQTASDYNSFRTREATISGCSFTPSITILSHWHVNEQVRSRGPTGVHIDVIGNVR
jgi:hypothetical protein